MARSRFQRGTIKPSGKRNPVWVLRYREDVFEDGATEPRRVQRETIIGTLKQYPTERLIRRVADDFLARTVNAVVYRPAYNMTFTSLAAKWKTLVVPQFKKSSARTAEHHVNIYLAPFFGDVDITHINTEMVQRFITKLSDKGLAPKTIDNILKTFKSMWTSAKAWGYVSHHPFDGIRKPKLRPPNRPEFTTEQIQRILSEAQEPFKTMYRIVAETGIRGGEVVALKRGDFDTVRRRVTVSRNAWKGNVDSTKGNRERRFAISKSLAQNLEAHFARLPEDQEFLFLSPRGKVYDNGNIVECQLKPLVKGLSIPWLERMGLHSFRRANGTLMDEIDVPLKTRTSRLGHATAAMTIDVYTKRIESADDLAVERMSSILMGNAGANEMATEVSGHVTIG